MKGHKAHHHEHPRAAHKKGGKVHRSHHGTGGDAPTEGEWAHDEAPKEVYAGAGSNVVKEAEEKKRGGRAKRKHGGHAMGKVHGEHAKKRGDRAARKSGGRAGKGSDRNPLSSAHAGKEPSSHHSYEPEHD